MAACGEVVLSDYILMAESMLSKAPSCGPLGEKCMKEKRARDVNYGWMSGVAVACR